MLASDGAAIRQIASLAEINHQEVISTARCTTPVNNLTVRHGVGNANNRDSSGLSERRNSLACTHESRTSTIIPAPASPLRPDEATRSKRFRRGQWSRQGQHEPRAAPTLTTAVTPVKATNPSTSHPRTVSMGVTPRQTSFRSSRIPARPARTGRPHPPRLPRVRCPCLRTAAPWGG